MLEWFYNNEALAGWLLLTSVFTFLGTIVAVPFMLIRLPQDYFSHPHRHRIPWGKRNRYLRIPVLLVKNIVGLVLIAAGILMLVLPGQGLLTMLIGLVLMDFPGKYQAECWAVKHHSVLHAINWIRTKAHKPNLMLPSADTGNNGD